MTRFGARFSWWNSENLSHRVASHSSALFHAAARPERLVVIQRALLGALALWGLVQLVDLIWALWPGEPMTPAPTVVNVAFTTETSSGVGEPRPDLAAALGRSAFGSQPAAAEAQIDARPNPRDGIESGAQETRLALKLTGIVASTEDGLGTVMIEARGEETTFSVGDRLPVSGNVTLAKVMRQQVVIDNSGQYELLTLFDEEALSGVAVSAARPAPVEAIAPVNVTERQVRIDHQDAVAVARDLRARLYTDPQSLAAAVAVAPVQENGQLQGYRVMPGSRADQFTALGLKSGDVVTAVNGLPLSDPANAISLYRVMREATEVNLDILRGGETVSLTVSLQ
jgi:general secretion pathway protein C